MLAVRFGATRRVPTLDGVRARDPCDKQSDGSTAASWSFVGALIRSLSVMTDPRPRVFFWFTRSVFSSVEKRIFFLSLFFFFACE